MTKSLSCNTLINQLPRCHHIIIHLQNKQNVVSDKYSRSMSNYHIKIKLYYTFFYTQFTFFGYQFSHHLRFTSTLPWMSRNALHVCHSFYLIKAFILIIFLSQLHVYQSRLKQGFDILPMRLFSQEIVVHNMYELVLMSFCGFPSMDPISYNTFLWVHEMNRLSIFSVAFK